LNRAKHLLNKLSIISFQTTLCKWFLDIVFYSAPYLLIELSINTFQTTLCKWFLVAVTYSEMIIMYGLLTISQKWSKKFFTVYFITFFSWKVFFFFLFSHRMVALCNTKMIMNLALLCHTKLTLTRYYKSKKEHIALSRNFTGTFFYTFCGFKGYT